MRAPQVTWRADARWINVRLLVRESKLRDIPQLY